MEEHTPQGPEATATTRDQQTIIILATTDHGTSPPLPPETIAVTAVHPAAKPLSIKGPTRTNGPPSCPRSNKN